MKNKDLEEKKLAVTKLELAIAKLLEEQRKKMLADPIRCRRNVEELRKEYMLNERTIGMFGSVGMITEYTNLLNKFNRILDGDYI